MISFPKLSDVNARGEGGGAVGSPLTFFVTLQYLERFLT